METDSQVGPKMSTDVEPVNNETEHGCSLDECRFPEIEMNRVSDCSSVDLESGEPEKESEIECRICHLGSTEGDEEDVIIELGCSCKGKLGTAHKQCAETWFKIKRNTRCEICSSEAVNITIVVQNEAVVGAGGGGTNTNATSAAVSVVVLVPAVNGESTWNGRRIMNTILACILMSFVMSWLFHLRMLSSDNL